MVPNKGIWRVRQRGLSMRGGSIAHTLKLGKGRQILILPYWKQIPVVALSVCMNPGPSDGDLRAVLALARRWEKIDRKDEVPEPDWVDLVLHG